MGRPDKHTNSAAAAAEEEAKRKAAVSALTGSEASSAAALGSLHAAAAVEALLKNTQGAAAAQGAVGTEQLFLGAAAAAAAAGGFDPLQTLSRNPTLLQRVAKSVLPRSAPVSSLLPPLPPDGLSPQGLLALQTHLASIGGGTPGALLGAAAASANAGLSSSLHGAATAGSDLSSVQHLLAAQAAAVPKPGIANALTPNMQTWSLEKLGTWNMCWHHVEKEVRAHPSRHFLFAEQHVNLLHQLKQPVPESVAVLLADARRKEAKKTAKRLANRKSASSSRARKKALVQEMTELNARLKRQAQILALLPDLVITINLEGVITFCSAQVERVLHHNTDDIVGAKLADLLVPSSRDKLNRLVTQLVASEQMAILGVAAATGAVLGGGGAHESGNDTEQALGNASNAEGGSAAVNSGPENASEVAIVSEPSFPMSVVKVKAKDGSSDDNENSDNSASVPGSKGPSSLTQESGASIPRSPTASLENSASDDAKNVKSGGKKGLPSSDTSNSSSLSTTAKKLQKANQNLEKNVRAHNKKMKKKGSASYKDDVTGADVTANNASARLSSLQHRSESSSEEDSGYRESNDSREETSSSASDSSSSNGMSSCGCLYGCFFWMN